MRNIFYSLGMLLICICNSGCFFSRDYKEVNVYDLGGPGRKLTLDAIVKVEPLMNESPCTGKVFYRLENNRVARDDYNRWAQDPSVMLTRYLMVAFAGQMDSAKQVKPRYSVSGVLLAFDVDLTQKKVILTTEYKVARHEEPKRYIMDNITITEPFMKRSAEAYSFAMKRAVLLLAEKIRSDIIRLEQGR